MPYNKPKFTTVIKTALFIGSVALMACAKTEDAATAHQPHIIGNPYLRGIVAYPQADSIYHSSVSVTDNNYVVDSSVVIRQLNKKHIIAALAPEYLSEVKTVDQIPAFLSSFLSSLSKNGELDMVNPGEEFKSGITNFGHQAFKKVYNAEKKDSVMMVTYDTHPLACKQLVYCGVGREIAVIAYNTGGLYIHQHLAIIQFEGTKILDFWFGNYNTDAKLTKANIIQRIKISGTREEGC